VVRKSSERDIIRLVLIAILLVTPLFAFYGIISIYGPSWDLVARSLNGHTLLDVLVSGIAPQIGLSGERLNNLNYYFESYREPLSTPIFAVLDVFFGNSILPYLVLVYVCFVAALLKFGKALEIDELVSISVFVNGYVLYFLFILNGGEALSVVFVFLGLYFLLKKKPLSGLMLGIASLAKYQTMILFPLVLLLRDRKKIVEAVAMEISMVAVWGVIDYFLYGTPFYSYIASIGASNVVSGPTAIYPSAFAMVILFPAVFGAMGIMYVIVKKRKLKLKLNLDYRWQIILGFVMLSFIGYVFTLPHNNLVTQARYGYLFGIAMLSAVALFLSGITKIRMLGYCVACVAIFLLLCMLYLIYVPSNPATAAYYNPNGTNGALASANVTLASLGYGNCRSISNAWVLMIYAGHDSYSPFVIYDNKEGPVPADLSAIGTENLTGVTGWFYPIIVFKYIGVSNSVILNLNNSRLAYSSANFSIYLPKNAGCYLPNG
jgi:hypothetical protein